MLKQSQAAVKHHPVAPQGKGIPQSSKLSLT